MPAALFYFSLRSLFSFFVLAFLLSNFILSFLLRLILDFTITFCYNISIYHIFAAKKGEVKK